MEHVGYFSVSTLQQGASGLGLAAQKELVMRFIGNRALLAEFTEVESGKRHRNRPQLLAALELCKEKKAKLVIAKLDRLSRNVAFIGNHDCRRERASERWRLPTVQAYRCGMGSIHLSGGEQQKEAFFFAVAPSGLFGMSILSLA
jgi:hypothetical protein